MAQLLDMVPNDAEIAAFTQPTNKQKAAELQQRKQVKKRLEALLERQQLQRAVGDDLFA
ncbi:PA3496 family putative envelope integrity protein [Shewanella maritima]|uniref:PA3496 family putative envelope integrity protein n=1 Tax=Shewanella maritima TaxID=2520507 RepID=UPI003735EFDA